MTAVLQPFDLTAHDKLKRAIRAVLSDQRGNCLLYTVRTLACADGCFVAAAHRAKSK
jgi:hypothetical protein